MIIPTNMINVLSSLPNDKLLEIWDQVARNGGLCSEDKAMVIKMLREMMENNRKQ